MGAEVSEMLAAVSKSERRGTLDVSQWQSDDTQRCAELFLDCVMPPELLAAGRACGGGVGGACACDGDGDDYGRVDGVAAREAMAMQFEEDRILVRRTGIVRVACAAAAFMSRLMQGDRADGKRSGRVAAAFGVERGNLAAFLRSHASEWCPTCRKKCLLACTDAETSCNKCGSPIDVGGLLGSCVPTRACVPASRPPSSPAPADLPAHVRESRLRLVGRVAVERSLLPAVQDDAEAFALSVHQRVCAEAAAAYGFYCASALPGRAPMPAREAAGWTCAQPDDVLCAGGKRRIAGADILDHADVIERVLGLDSAGRRGEDPKAERVRRGRAGTLADISNMRDMRNTMMSLALALLMMDHGEARLSEDVAARGVCSSHLKLARAHMEMLRRLRTAGAPAAAPRGVKRAR